MKIEGFYGTISLSTAKPLILTDVEKIFDDMKKEKIAKDNLKLILKKSKQKKR